MTESAPKRKAVRLSEYDYSQNGFYFVTVCARDKQPIFWADTAATNQWLRRAGGQGRPPLRANDSCPRTESLAEKDGTPPKALSAIGKIVKQCWEEINAIYPNVRTDYYAIMPDHFHGIIVIDTPAVGADDSVRPQENIPAPPSLSKIMQGFKSVSTRRCFRYGYRQIWQRGYYEHIIRNYDDYINTAQYILNNPQKMLTPP